MKIVQGNLIELAEKTDFDVIIHGCNCFNTMGSGIAKQIKDRYPAVYEQDYLTVKGDISKLGGFTWKAVSQPKGWWFVIINAYTQYHYGRGQIHVDYEAIRKVFGVIAEKYNYARIGYPKIGAGLAGGDWNIISKIIDEELINCDHTLVIL